MAVPRSGFYFLAVPSGDGFAEIGFVGHVAGQRGVVAEDDVFDVGFARAHGVEVGPHVRFLFVPGNAVEGHALQAGFVRRFGVMLFVPLVDVLLAHNAWKTGNVVSGRFVLAGLWVVSERVFADFENSLGAVEAIYFGRLGAAVQ